MRLNSRVYKSLASLMFVAACNQAATDDSCLTSFYFGGADVLQENLDLKTGMIQIEGTSENGLKSCNAAVDPLFYDQASDQMTMRITTAKHCMMPTETKRMKMMLSYNGAFIHGELSGRFVERVQAISEAVGYKKISNLADYDTEKHWRPNLNGAVFPDHEDLVSGKFPGHQAYLNAILEETNIIPGSDEPRRETSDPAANQMLCYKQGGTACFFASDATVFEAVFTPEKDGSSLTSSKSILSQAFDKYSGQKFGKDHTGRLLNLYADRTQLDLEILGSQLLISASTCGQNGLDQAEREIVCGSARNRILRLTESPSFYSQNKVFKSASEVMTYAQSDDTRLEKAIININEEIFKIFSNLSPSSSQITLINLTENTSTDSASREKMFKQFDLRSIADPSQVRFTPYGLVTPVDQSKIQLLKRDSGSMLLVDGTPWAILSVYDREPISGGLAYALPKAEPGIDEAPEIPGSSQGGVASTSEEATQQPVERVSDNQPNSPAAPSNSDGVVQNGQPVDCY